MAGFHPSADDLDYPGKLQRHASQPVNGQANAADADSMVRTNLCRGSAALPGMLAGVSTACLQPGATPSSAVTKSAALCLRLG